MFRFFCCTVCLILGAYCNGGTNLTAPKNAAARIPITNCSSRIIGGNVVREIEKFPFMAFLMRTVGTQTSSCTATILSRDFVLTAAHCFNGCFLPGSVSGNIYCCLKEFQVYAGSVVPNTAISTSGVEIIHLHPSYKKYDNIMKCKNPYDIAVLKLEIPLEFSNKISSVKLSTQPISTDVTCTILGWGRTKRRTRLHRQLRFAHVPLIPIPRCKRIIYEIVKSSKKLCEKISLCSLHPSRSVFKGDSGGPIICGDVQAGLTSWSVKKKHPKQIGFPNVFTRIDLSVKWINKIMSKS